MDPYNSWRSIQGNEDVDAYDLNYKFIFCSPSVIPCQSFPRNHAQIISSFCINTLVIKRWVYYTISSDKILPIFTSGKDNACNYSLSTTLQSSEVDASFCVTLKICIFFSY